MAKSAFGISNLTKNCNEILILSILSEGRKHGYQIAIEIEERSENYFKFNHGTLYPILHKLELEGFIKGLWKQEGPKRKRKYYTLSAKGKKYSVTQVNEWQNFFNHFNNIIGEINK